VNDTPLFKLDDSDNPGYARVQLLKPKFQMLGYQCWQAKITEIIKPSDLIKYKVGTQHVISERWLSDRVS
jgi:hypothetical protein